MAMKLGYKIAIGVGAALLIGGGIYLAVRASKKEEEPTQGNNTNRVTQPSGGGGNTPTLPVGVWNGVAYYDQASYNTAMTVSGKGANAGRG